MYRKQTLEFIRERFKEKNKENTLLTKKKGKIQEKKDRKHHLDHENKILATKGKKHDLNQEKKKVTKISTN